MDEQSLFLQALEKPAGDERAVWLHEACGPDQELRERIETLVDQHDKASGFLEKPALGLALTILPNASDGGRAAALDAGLATAFDVDSAVVLGDANHSVLRSLEHTMNDVPRVLLRESNSEKADPITRPSSSEIPKPNANSRYQLQGEIARGGMGAIIKGRDNDLGRDLAIKVLLGSLVGKPEVVQRFIEEAQIGGQLQHPGIAPIYELGQFADKRPFFAMKLVKGQTLSKLLSDREDAADERGKLIGIFEQICQTMAYAHSRGVIHRDLKPANVMVGAFGEVQVMDWGLAKVLATGGVADEKTAQNKQQGQSIVQTMRSGLGSDIPAFGSAGSHTQMGSVMGTPAYMPPEQALGEIDSMDERADVFGLGAILCEILTGQPPYVADDGTRVFRMASRGKLDDALARLDACDADEDLIALTKHCLEREPVDRPRDAGVLAERVTGYLESVEEKLRAAEVQRAAEAARADAEGAQAAAERQRAEAESQRAEAQAARAEAESARASEEKKRRRTSLMLAASVLLLVGLGGGGWLYMERQEANRQTADADAQRAHAIEMQTLAEQRDDQRKAAELARNVAEVAQRQADTEKINSLNMLADMQTERGVLAGEDDPATAALWFTTAAKVTPHDPVREAANHLRAKNWLNQAMIPVASLYIPKGSGAQMEFQPDGELLLTLNSSGMRIWDWRLEEPLPWTVRLHGVVDACWSPDGSQVAGALGSGTVDLLEIPSGRLRLSIPSFPAITVVKWSPDGDHIAIAGSGVQIWNVAAEPKMVHEWAHPLTVYDVRFNLAGDLLVTACDDQQARLFRMGEDTVHSSPLFDAFEHQKTRAPSAPVFFDADQRLVTRAARGVRSWNVANGEEMISDIPVEENFGLSSSPDGQWIVALDNSTGTLSDTSGNATQLKHDNANLHAVFSPDGKLLMTSGFEYDVGIWRLPTTGRPSFRVAKLDTEHATGSFSSDGRYFAVGGNVNCTVWRFPEANTVLGRVEEWKTLCRPRASMDGKLATLGVWHEGTFPPRRSGELQVVQMEDGQPAGPAITCPGSIIDSCIGSDNRSVAAAFFASGKGHLAVYDVGTGREAFPSITLPDHPISLAARPGHAELAVLCKTGDLLVVDANQGTAIRKLPHDTWGTKRFWATTRVAYSPDGSTLVTLSPSDQLFVRDASTGDLRYPPVTAASRGGFCRAIAFSRDSRFLATAINGVDFVQVWDLNTGQPVGREMPHPGASYGTFSVEFSPDGESILTAHSDRRLRWWDWKTGQLKVPPMQDSKELYDCRFTPDGSFGLTTLRKGGIGVWDLKTGKPAAPEIHYPADWKFEGTVVFGLSGLRGIVGCAYGHAVVDFSFIFEKPESSLAQTETLAELASHRTLQLGELTRVINWKEKFASYPRHYLTAPALALKLDEMGDTSSRLMLASHAARRNLLAELVELRPEVAELHESHGRELKEKGDQTTARAHYNKAIELYERALQDDPENESLAGSSIADLVVDKFLVNSFSLLTPVEMKSEAGTNLTLRKDGSILASQEPKLCDSYTITTRPTTSHIAVLRLEALTDPGIVGDGPGWGGGNFHLTEIRAVLRRTGQEDLPLQFSTATADHKRSPAEGARPSDGPLAVIDGDQGTLWDIWPQTGSPHWLLLPLAESIQVTGEDRIIVKMDFRDSRWPEAKLGCFRLSAAPARSSVIKLQLAGAIGNADLSGVDTLVAAHLVSGNVALAAELLEPTIESDDSLVRLLLRATTQRMQDDAEAARETAARFVESLKTETLPRSLHEPGFDLVNEFIGLDRQHFSILLEQGWTHQELARLSRQLEGDMASAATYRQRAIMFARQGQWRKSADDSLQAVKLNPGDRRDWGVAASALLMAGEDEEYRQHCRAMLKQFKGTVEIPVADTVCKTSLLLADGVEPSELSIRVVRNGATSASPGFSPWFTACNALISYRQGQPANAIEWTNKMPRLDGEPGALALVVRAMSEAKLGRLEDAENSLAAAQLLIPVELGVLPAVGYSGPILPQASIGHDWLVAEILRREAEMLIKSLSDTKSDSDVQTRQ